MVIIQKLPILLECIYNGLYIVFYFLLKSDILPFRFSEQSFYQFLDIYCKGIPFVIFFVMMMNYIIIEDIEEFFRKHVFTIIVFVSLMLIWGDLEFSFWFSSIHLISSFFALYERSSLHVRIVEFFKFSPVSFKLHPTQLVLLTFLAPTLLGTFLLMLPISHVNDVGTYFSDAFFMAISAVCVTGLSTVSLADNFSTFGQIVILILIQIGGLGIMILYSSMTIFLGKSMAMKDRVVMQDVLDMGSMEELMQTIVDIIKYTFFIELWGAFILSASFFSEGANFSFSIYSGIFHSISAFCNAGFSLYPDSIGGFVDNSIVVGTLSSLIVLGGLGFMVLKELQKAFIQKQGIKALGLHSKTVLVGTVFLIFSGAIIIFFGEFLHGIDNYSLWGKIKVSLFQSITLRTAGFTIVPLNVLYPHTIYLMCMFMWVGAGPGSTGGGIKITTLAVLVQSIKSTLKGKEKVELYDRAIPNRIVVKSTALAIMSMIIVSFFIFLLMKIESEKRFLDIFFEVISASGTVGLSLGITEELSALGKVVLSIVMFIGRVGPLTMVLAIGNRRADRQGHFEYPYGKVMIG